MDSWSVDVQRQTINPIIQNSSNPLRLCRAGIPAKVLSMSMWTIQSNMNLIKEAWQTVVNIEPRIKSIEITEETITAHLEDGRTISVPLVWSWRLSEATAEQRDNFEMIGDGIGVHWPEIDEDISADGMLSGFPQYTLKGSKRNLHKRAINNSLCV